MTELGEAVGLFFLNARILLMRMLQYRLDFLVGILVALGFSLVGPLFQFLLYSRSRGYPGWSWDQILLLQAVLLFTSGLCDVLFGSVRTSIDNFMRKGEFDRLLLKPYPPLLLLLTGGFKPYGMGSLLVGLGATVWAVTRIGCPAGAEGFLVFLALVGARVLLQIAFHTFYCTLSVRWIYTWRLDEIMDKLFSFGNYPLEIFPNFLRLAFATIIPFSMACYWPAKALLEPLSRMVYVSLLGTIALFLVALRLWRAQLKSYVSAGG